jgi:hypothetical protein
LNQQEERQRAAPPAALVKGMGMAAKRAGRSDFAARKKAPTPEVNTQPSPVPERRGQTLRLSIEAWRQLKIMAVEEGKPAHDLLVSAVNDFFVKHGKPPIA